MWCGKARKSFAGLVWEKKGKLVKSRKLGSSSKVASELYSWILCEEKESVVIPASYHTHHNHCIVVGSKGGSVQCWWW